MKEERETEVKDEKLDLTNFICDICKRKFTNYRAFGNHKLKHDTRTFTCLNCGIQLLGIKKFCDHMQRYKFVTCHICGKDIKSRKKYRHFKTCLIKKEKGKPKREELFCNFCNYKTMDSFNMKRHSNLHIKKSCNDCHEEFDNQTLLKKHLRKVHMPKVTKIPKLIKCKWENCVYSSARPYQVKRHESTCSKGQTMEVVSWF